MYYASSAPHGALARTPTESAHPRGPAPTRTTSRKSPRLELLERLGCFGPGPQSVRIERATTADDLRRAYALVHDAYVEDGYIFPRPDGLRMRVYEAMPDTATFVAKAGEKVVGVTSLVVDSANLGLPSEPVFPDEIASLRRPGRQLAEVTNWAIAPEYRRTPIVTELHRCYFAHLLAAGCPDVVAAISPGHQAFFGLLGYNTLVSTPRTYTQDLDDPVVLVHLTTEERLARFEEAHPDVEDDTAVLRRYFLDNNPYHDKVNQWAARAESVLADPVSLRSLCADEGGLAGQDWRCSA